LAAGHTKEGGKGKERRQRRSTEETIEKGQKAGKVKPRRVRTRTSWALVGGAYALASPRPPPLSFTLGSRGRSSPGARHSPALLRLRAGVGA
jgi:hypothetical protein